MTATPPPEGATERREVAHGPACNDGLPYQWGGVYRCGGECIPDRPVSPVPAAEDDAVEGYPDLIFAAQFAAHRDRSRAALDAILAAERERDTAQQQVPALRAEVERWVEAAADADVRAEAWAAEARKERELGDEARQQVAALRARIEDRVEGLDAIAAYLADPANGCHVPAAIIAGVEASASLLRAALAEGGQPGEVACTCWGRSGSLPHRQWCQAAHDRPAPAVPDSAGLRQRIAAMPRPALASPEYRKGYGDALDDVLVVVGQGVSAEQAWDEAASRVRVEHIAAALRMQNPYRAVVRSGEQGGDRG